MDVLLHADKVVAMLKESKDAATLKASLRLRNEIKKQVLRHIEFERKLQPYNVTIRDWSDNLRHPVYWLDQSTDSMVGPSCGHCWEKHQVLEQLTFITATGGYICQTCKTVY